MFEMVQYATLVQSAFMGVHLRSIVLGVLIHPAISIALGGFAIIALWWYWNRLGQGHVPVSRRRLRRITTMVILAAIPLMVAALSFISRHTHPREFIIAWTLVFVLMLLIILGAGLDALNSLRLHQQHLDREVADAAKELLEATRRRQRAEKKKDRKS